MPSNFWLRLPLDRRVVRWTDKIRRGWHPGSLVDRPASGYGANHGDGEPAAGACALIASKGGVP